MNCGDPLPLRRVALGTEPLHPVRDPAGCVVTLPVCWCGDPGTYALDPSHPVLVNGAPLPLCVWEREDTAPVMVVARCRAHAGPFASEVTTGQLVPVALRPIDGTPWGVS